MGGAKGVPHVHHGMAHTRLYKSWASMMNRCGYSRCSNPAAIKYYIHKGITVCPEWRLFLNFKEWALSNGYRDDLTIDRIDSDRNYEPCNCQWVTMAANLRKRSGVKLTMEKAAAVRLRKARGERAEDLAIEYGVQVGQIYRICDGTRWNEGVA